MQAGHARRSRLGIPAAVAAPIPAARPLSAALSIAAALLRACVSIGFLASGTLPARTKSQRQVDWLGRAARSRSCGMARRAHPFSRSTALTFQPKRALSGAPQTAV